MRQFISTSFSDSVSSTRLIYTPSAFARSSLIHLQETGTLQALRPHKNERSNLHSYLFFTVLSGFGKLSYCGRDYDLRPGDCIFIDCRKSYSHETGISGSTIKQKDNFADISPADALWSLQWCHFDGPNMNAIYQKYQERGGKPFFQTEYVSKYHNILADLYKIADSADYVRDMRIHEKLSSLLTLLMEDAWDPETESQNITNTVDIQQIKDYLDTNYLHKISLDTLASKFYINKYYLLTLFKERYGVTVNTYLNQMRITYVKQQLRFSDRTIDSLATELHIEPTYLSRLFKKVEGISPSEFRRIWKGR